MSVTGDNDPKAHRRHAARLANRYRESGDPSGWFEEFYEWASGAEDMVPWADLVPHPLLVDWLASQSSGDFESVAVVGCGLGHDAEAMPKFARSVWAFDVSSTCIEWARRLHPDSLVEYEVADLYSLPTKRLGVFDLVVEVYTLQALPPEHRPAAIKAMADLICAGGQLVVVTRWRRPEDELGPVPWPLLQSEIDLFGDHGLVEEERTESEPGEAIRSVWRKPLGD